MTPEEAIKQGIRFTLHSGDSSSWFSSRRIGLEHSGYTVLVDGNTGMILGAHLFGYHADEAINIFALAMKAVITADDLRAMIWSYPTAVYDIGYMIE